MLGERLISRVVYKGKCRRQDVAIKILDKQVLDPETLDSFRREVDIIGFRNLFSSNFMLEIAQQIFLENESQNQ